jgi:hypothetical protein
MGKSAALGTACSKESAAGVFSWRLDIFLTKITRIESDAKSNSQGGVAGHGASVLGAANDSITQSNNNRKEILSAANITTNFS